MIWPAGAQDADDVSTTTMAEQAFDKGEYSLASLLAEKQKDYDLAIRAALIHGGYYASDIAEATEWLDRAHTLVDVALAMDTHHMRHRVSLSLILSYKAKKLKSVGLVMRAKHIIDGLMRDFPDEAMPQGVLAGWHSEISAAGFFPRLILGGSRSKARQHFVKALELDDSKISLNLEYAKFLARGDKKERKMAEKALSALLEAELHNDFERLLQCNARKILVAVQSGDRKTIKRVIAESSAFPEY